jgi:hypothetical protein
VLPAELVAWWGHENVARAEGRAGARHEHRQTRDAPEQLVHAALGVGRHVMLHEEHGGDAGIHVPKQILERFESTRGRADGHDRRTS